MFHLVEFSDFELLDNNDLFVIIHMLEMQTSC
jgi:hypothetical protein